MITIKQKLKPSLSYMLNFRNLEFFDTVNDIFNIVSNSDIQSVSIRPHINQLMQFKERYETLVSSTRSHDNTTLIDEKFSNARIYLIIMKNTIDSMQKLSGDSEYASIKRLSHWIAPVRQHMNTRNKAQQAFTIEVLAQEYANDKEIEAGVDACGLSGTFQKVMQLNQQMKQLKHKRRSDKTTLKEMRHNFREEFVFTLQLLSYALISEVQLNGNESDECYELCSLLNKTVAEGRTIQKSLETRKQSANEASETDEAGETEASNHTESPLAMAVEAMPLLITLGTTVEPADDAPNDAPPQWQTGNEIQHKSQSDYKRVSDTVGGSQNML